MITEKQEREFIPRHIRSGVKEIKGFDELRQLVSELPEKTVLSTDLSEVIEIGQETE